MQWHSQVWHVIDTRRINEVFGYTILDLMQLKQIIIKSGVQQFDTRAAVFLAKIKARWEGEQRILLGDNTGSRAVEPWPNNFPVCWRFDFGWTPFSWPYVYSAPTCPKLDLCRTYRKVTVTDVWPAASVRCGSCIWRIWRRCGHPSQSTDIQKMKLIIFVCSL